MFQGAGSPQLGSRGDAFVRTGHLANRISGLAEQVKAQKAVLHHEHHEQEKAK
jgi:hypothetical protein